MCRRQLFAWNDHTACWHPALLQFSKMFKCENTAGVKVAAPLAAADRVDSNSDRSDAHPINLENLFLREPDGEEGIALCLVGEARTNTFRALDGRPAVSGAAADEAAHMAFDRCGLCYSSIENRFFKSLARFWTTSTPKLCSRCRLTCTSCHRTSAG